MSLHLDKIEINRFRGIEEYTINSFGNWSSITGPNSSNKSTIINALSLLGSNRMHDISDIPTWYDLNLVNPREVPIKVKYLFRLNESFDKLMSDSRIKETLVSLYEEQLNRTTETFKGRLETSLRSLRNDGPLSKLLNKALYEAIRREFESKPQYEPYKPLFYSDGRFKMPDDIFKDVKFLEINLEMSLSDGPEYRFSFLDERENTIIDDEVFYHWLKYQNAIDDEISLAFVIGAVFIKSIINSQSQEDELTFPPTILASDGSNIKQYIEYSLTHHPNIFTNIGDNFKKLFGHTVQVKKASIANQYDVIIWVEGPSDKIYLEKWLNLLLNEDEITISSQIGILPYGGKPLLKHLKIEAIKSINRKSIFIIDSDKKSENEEIDPDTRNFISICNKNNINYWLTERRTIENYIPLNILETKLNIDPGIMQITRFNDIFESLKKIGRNNIGKVELAKIIASDMTIQKIRDDIEFYKEIQKNIVQKIVKYPFDKTYGI